MTEKYRHLKKLEGQEQRDLNPDGNFSVHITGETTLSQLVQEEPTRTPHVGNVNLAHLLTLLQPEILHLFIDTLDKSDPNFRPGVVMRAGETTDIPNINPSAAMYAQPELIEKHMDALQALSPEAHVRTETEFVKELSQNIDLIEVMDSMGEASITLGLWKWYDTGNGVKIERTPVSWAQIKEEGFAMFERNERIQQGSGRGGWVLPNEFRIALYTVIESLMRKRDAAHHISGPDMYRYIKMHLKAFETLYAAAKKTFGQKLPKKLHFFIYPMADVRLAVPMSFRDRFNRLLELSERNPQLRQIRRTVMKDWVIDAEKQKEIQAGFRGIDGVREREIATLVGQSGVLFNVKDPANMWLTQHDLQPGVPLKEQLYVHPLIADLTIQELNNLTTLWRITRRKRRHEVQ